MRVTVNDMKVIQVRNVPDEVHSVLRTRAAASGLSLSDYVLAELKTITAQPTVAEVIERARRRAESRQDGPTGQQIVDIIRADRDSETR